MGKPLGVQVAELEAECDRLRAENAELRAGRGRWPEQPYHYAVLPDGRVMPYEEAKHIKDGEVPSRLSVHRLNVAPAGSVAIKPEGSIFAPMRKTHNGQWVTIGDQLMNTRAEWSPEDLIEYGWADATLHLPEDQR